MFFIIHKPKITVDTFLTKEYTFGVIQQVLQQLGLGTKEISVYLTILQQGKVTAADIATLTKINRTTVYAIAKELLKKGFIQESVGKRTYYVARPLEDLVRITEQDREKLNQKEHLIQSAIGELKLLSRNERYEVPRLTFIEEDGLAQHMYQQSERWTESILQTDGIWHGFQDHSFVEHYEDWIDWYWAQKFSKDVVLRCFTNDSEIEKKMAKKQLTRRRMKFWGNNEITSTFWVNGDHVVVIVTRTRPHYLFEIKDRLLATNLREVFGKLWEDEKRE